MINVYTNIEMVYRLTVTVTENNSLIVLLYIRWSADWPTKKSFFQDISHPSSSLYIIYFQFPST